MTRTFTSIFIDKSPETVFNYVTTASQWPAWHPASMAVSGSVDHSAAPGEQIIEEISFMGRRERFTWTVRERQPPNRWVFEGHGRSGAESAITYTLSTSGSGTLFERELVYTMGSPFIRLLDRLFLRRRMSAVSRKALIRLKQVLEKA